MFFLAIGVSKLNLRNIAIGIFSVTLLAACGQAEPDAPAMPAADEALEDDFPDLILDENE